MLTGIHFLLTYKCTYECDHCFLYCSPEAGGTFTLIQIKDILEEAKKIGTVEWIYFEGGEPFLYYPLMLEGIKLARDFGFKTGIVTNAYWALSEEDAEFWLKPLCDLEISDISVSDDPFHYEDEKYNLAKRAYNAAKKLNLPVSAICIDKPTIETDTESQIEKGAPVIGGDVLFKGRAAEKLTEGLPLRDAKEFTECPHEKFVSPERVHIDVYGNVQICQGISMGNLWKTPLSSLIKNYDAKTHPIIWPLIKGGPALLYNEYCSNTNEKFVDECHLCFNTRLALLDKFPDTLAPRQVYGIE